MNYTHHHGLSCSNRWQDLHQAKSLYNDDVMKWKHFPRYWPFVRGNHRPPVDSPHKCQWRGALVFSLICAWTNGWGNNRDAGDLRRHRAHYEAIVMLFCPNTQNNIRFNFAFDFFCWKATDTLAVSVAFQKNKIKITPLTFSRITRLYTVRCGLRPFAQRQVNVGHYAYTNSFETKGNLRVYCFSSPSEPLFPKW